MKTLVLLIGLCLAAGTAVAQVPQWPDGWPTVDQYGGITAITVAGSNGQWRVAKVGNRWVMVDPLDHPTWVNGVWVVTECCNSIARYGSSLNWSVQTLKRLNRWGFTFIWDHSFGSVWPNAAGQTNPMPMPYFQDGNDYPDRPEKAVLPGYCTTGHTAKTIGGALNLAYAPPAHNVGTDPYDPCFTIWNNAFWAPATRPAEATNAMANSYFIGWSSAESDFIQFMGAASGTNFISTPPGKEADSSHGAWNVLAANPIVSSEQIPTGATVTFIDTQLYAKTALQTFLQGRYGTIANLNAAWASTYTTFGSDGGWGNTGNGLMDENGNTGRHAWVGSWNTLNGETAAMKTDLNDFLFQMASKFFQVQRDAFKAAYPLKLYLGPNIVGSWGNPARSPVLQAAALYVDALQMNIGTGAVNDQARLDFVGQYFGDKPIMNWMGFPANPNSAICGTAGICTNPDTWQVSNTQAARGAIYTTLYLWQYNSALTSNGSHIIIGQRWWELSDRLGEGTNWGLETYTKGNAYDGAEAVVAAHNDAWGFPAGGEAQNYGNFLGPGTNTVINTNLAIMLSLAGITPPPGGKKVNLTGTIVVTGKAQ